jgi:hypothetical protein
MASRRQFLDWMADRFQERLLHRNWFLRLIGKRMGRSEAKMHAIGTLLSFQSMERIGFGDADYSWDQEAAHDLVDEELQHWEA